MKIGSLFSGIGGLELGLEMVGLGPVLWQVEIDPFCRRVLAKHWPHATRFEDVTRPRDYPYVDLICGGSPCQDFSSLGKGRGIGGDRSGLWYHYARVVAQVEPEFVLVENVASGLSRWLHHIRHHLHVLGYRTRALRIGAEDVGAPHVRRRIFVIASRVSPRRRRPDAPARARGLRAAPSDGSRGAPAHAGSVSSAVEQEGGPRLAGAWNGGRDGRAPVSAIRGMDDGLSGQLDAARKRALGNAVMPQCAAVAGRVILQMLNGGDRSPHAREK